MSASAELSTLLSSLGLGQHIGAIVDLGAEDVEDLEDATDAELISLGLQPSDIATLRAAIANPTKAPTAEAPVVVVAQPLIAEVPVLQPITVQPVRARRHIAEKHPPPLSSDVHMRRCRCSRSRR